MGARAFLNRFFAGEVSIARSVMKLQIYRNASSMPSASVYLCV